MGEWQDPLIMLPGRAAKQVLAPVYEKISKNIRKEDNETLIFFEPVTWAYLLEHTSGFDTAPDPQSVLSYHYYCTLSGNASYPSILNPTKGLCDKYLGPAVLKGVDADRKKLKVPSMMTEWGNLFPTASSPKAASTQEIEAQMDLADEYLQSWTFWDILFL